MSDNIMFSEKETTFFVVVVVEGLVGWLVGV